MKAVVLVLVALVLAGCEHMYGGVDAGRLSTHDVLGAPK